MAQRNLVRSVFIFTAALTVVLFVLATWLWFWKPPTKPVQPESLAQTSLAQAEQKTSLSPVYPTIKGMSVQFAEPTELPHLSANDIIAKNWRTMNGAWYQGPVQIFYARVNRLPGTENGQNVWVIEDHMPFAHSSPLDSGWRDYIHKLRLVLGIAQPIEATSFHVFDAVTGNPLGEFRIESGGY